MPTTIQPEKPAILVVDDEQDIRDGCQRILSRMGCSVHLADQGQAALDILASETISVALLDLKMPGMDGIDVLKHIQDQDPDILVIIITGYATLETAIDAMKKGAYDFIAKPFTPDQLRLGVQRALDKRWLTVEAAKNLALSMFESAQVIKESIVEGGLSELAKQPESTLPEGTADAIKNIATENKKFSSNVKDRPIISFPTAKKL